MLSHLLHTSIINRFSAWYAILHTIQLMRVVFHCLWSQTEKAAVHAGAGAPPHVDAAPFVEHASEAESCPTPSSLTRRVSVV